MTLALMILVSTSCSVIINVELYKIVINSYFEKVFISQSKLLQIIKWVLKYRLIIVKALNDYLQYINVLLHMKYIKSYKIFDIGNAINY